MLHQIYIHFQGHLPIYGLIEIHLFIVLSLNCDFNWNLSMKYNNSFLWLVIIFQNVNIKTSHNDDWTLFKRLLNYSLKIV